MKKSLKRFLPFAFTAVVMSSCCNSNSYSINGTIGNPSFDGMKVYLYSDTVYLDENSLLDGYLLLDSAVIEDQKFSFYGILPTARGAQIRTEEKENGMSLYLNFILEPGNIDLAITDADSTDHIGGTPLNDSLQSYNNRYQELRKQFFRSDDPLMKRLNEIDSLFNAGVFTEDSINPGEIEKLSIHNQELEEAFNKPSKQLAWDFYHNNSGNILAIDALHNSSIANLLDDEIFIDSLAKTATGPAKEYLEMKIEGLHRYKKYQNRLAEIQKRTSAGKPYINVDGIVKTYDNGQWQETSGSLRDIIGGRLAIVDFWASWCGPCRQEIEENLISINEKYKDKGLVVVGLDVLDDISAHAKAVSDLGISYSQLIDTTRIAINEYGVEGIPTIFLIAPDGTILARDLRGGEIETAVKKALKK